jgi:uncharacterized protein with PQ loop repeat
MSDNTRKLYIDILGYVGGGVLAVQNIPLLVRIYKRRSTGDLSYHTLGFFLFGGATTIAYGALIRAPPIYATLALSWTVNFIILMLKIQYDKPLTEGRSTNP